MDVTLQKKLIGLSVCLSEKVFFNTSPSILDIHLNQAHQWICLVKTNKMLEADFWISFLFGFKIQNSKKICFSGWTMLKSFCQYFFNFSSTSKLRKPIHLYCQDEEDGQNRFSNFIFLKFKIQLLFYVNPRVTVMKVLLFVFAGAMVDLSTPLVFILYW